MAQSDPAGGPGRDPVAHRNETGSPQTNDPTLRSMADEGKIAIIGALYHIETGMIEFVTKDAIGAPL